MARPKISIIIPTTGKNPLLEDCLASIRRLNYPKTKIQTIVTTNKDLKKVGIKFSFSASVNFSAKKAKGDYLLITNDDIVFKPKALKAWADAARQHPNTILGAKISLPTEKPAPAGYTINLWTGIAKPVYTGNVPASCDWVSGCALFINHPLWKQLKGFDEGFLPGFFEDADLCFRARRLEVSSLLWPEAQVIHSQTVTFNRNKPKKYEYWYRNKIRFLTKHASPLQLATSLILQYALITPARAIFLHDGRLLPAVKGLIWNINNFQIK